MCEMRVIDDGTTLVTVLFIVSSSNLMIQTDAYEPKICASYRVIILILNVE